MFREEKTDLNVFPSSKLKRNILFIEGLSLSLSLVSVSLSLFVLVLCGIPSDMCAWRAQACSSARFCPHREALRPWLSKVCPVGINQIAQVRRAIRVFAGRACRRDVF